MPGCKDPSLGRTQAYAGAKPGSLPSIATLRGLGKAGGSIVRRLPFLAMESNPQGFEVVPIATVVTVN